MRNTYSHSRLILCFLLISAFAFGQKDKKKPEPGSEFPAEELFKLLRTGINQYRAKASVDSMDNNEILAKAAEMSATSMAKDGKADPNSGGKSPGEKLNKSGGTKKADECEYAIIMDKGRKHYTAAEMAEIILTKWKADKREKVALLNPQWVFTGFAVKPDKMGKKYYVSCMLGGFESFNSGAKKKGELKVPFNTKSKKLKGPDVKGCKQCAMFKDYEKLRDGITIEKGKIYLNYNNLKYLKKLLKKPKDGLAVDIVQYAQYEKADYNIVDNNYLNKGIMQKVIYKDKVFSKNLIKPDPKAKKKTKINKLKLLMGTMPPAIKGKYEFNVIVVQDGKVCKTIMRAYLENGDQESNTPLDMIPMPAAEVAIKPPFEPRSETSILNFVVPFEKGKFEFKPEDIKPFLDAMQEPDFNIEGLYIYAYSSIEGDSVTNAKLQRKRGESITKVLQSMQKTQIAPSIITNDSWGLFQLEMEDGKYDNLAKMTKHQAIKTINSKASLQKELEPYLAKQRFAQIVMDVAYDITGAKEEKFAYLKFNQAVRQDNYNLAYKIMDFIYHKTKSGHYNHEVWDKMEIPWDKKYAGLHMQRKYYDYLEHGKIIDEEDYAEVMKISDLDPTNNYIKFNKLYCKILVDSTVGEARTQTDIQTAIDGFYTTDMAKKNVDGLNIEWNFKQIDYYDTIEGMEAKVDQAVERIKKFYNFKDASWQNSLKLAFVFTRSKDYTFAANILEPFVRDGKGDENLLFTYISLASHVPEKFFARTFSDALLKAKEKYPERYCKLFGEPFMSFQVLDNPNIKKAYNEASCPK
ncbi:MAG: hypothetical protein IAF38_19400 [Bacteroidia bacterium]|nr:hypothetical protein [Bacteroidia bacterium]